MHRVALYARVSTMDRGQDPEVQLVELRAWAARLEATEIVGEYVDQASGSKADRKALAQLMRDAHERRFDTVLVWALDRLSREGIGPMLQHIERLRSAGVRLRSFRDPWLDTDAPTTPLLIAVLAWVAAQERERIRERVRSGMAKAKTQGTKSGRPIGRPKAAVPYDVLQLLTAGRSVAQAAAELGVSENTVKRIKRRFRGEASEVPHAD